MTINDLPSCKILHKSLDYHAYSCHIVEMKRYLYEQIKIDLSKKMVFLTGPRQIGKTYLARQLIPDFDRPQYFNYDSIDDARIISSRSWPLNAGLLIFDEIHKMRDWKMFLKGVYDTRRQDQALLVTGSARMETFRQSGESLAGRYFHYRFFPISVREMMGKLEPGEAVSMLNRFGGFPEPFLSGSEDDAARWRKQYYTDLIREDILDFTRVHEIRSMRLLVELLREKVGSPLSYNSLAADLQIAPNTVRRYVDILESLYVIFLVRPYHRNVARAILKEPKAYFYDSGFVKGDEGIRLENTCAVSLMKHVAYLQDAKGENISLHYLRTKDGREIDFATSQNDSISQLIEVKLSDDAPSRNLYYFKKIFPDATACQLVHHLRHEQTFSDISIRSAGLWLHELVV